MKKQTQLKLAPFFGMADGRKIHGLGTFRPAPVVVNDNSTNYTFGSSCVVNFANGNINTNGSDDLAARRIGPPSKQKVSKDTRRNALTNNMYVGAINDESRKKQGFRH